MSKPDPEHFDKLGNRVNINDVVAVGHHNGLMIAKVIKINPKMIRVREFKAVKYSWASGEYNKYSSEMVRIPEPDAVMYILKNT
jgi:hypothetical protein